MYNRYRPARKTATPLERHDGGREGGIGKSTVVQEDGIRASRMDQRVVLTVIAAGVVLALDAVTPLGLAVWLFQMALVWSASLWANRRQMIVVAVVCSLCIVLGFLLSPKTGLATSIELCNLLLSLGAVWAITQTCLRQRATENARREAAKELAQSQETVRILSGLLPICAWCKKIRNEAGAWEQLELYIRTHSQAEFTHGMCEECAARLNEEEDAR